MLEIFQPAGPGVGANIDTTTFPSVMKRGMAWIPKLIRVRLTADANVATRTVTFRLISSDSIETFTVQAPMNQTASQVVDYQLALDVNENTFAPLGTVNGIAIMPLPCVKLFGQVILKTVTNNIQAGDLFSDILILAEQCEA